MSVSASGNYGVIAAASGDVEVVSLGGTGGSPIVLFGGGSVDPGDDTYGTWLWACSGSGSIVRGNVQKRTYSSGQPIPNWTSVNSAATWVNIKDFQDGPYYIRFRFVVGTGQQPDSQFGGIPLPLEEEGDIGDGDWVTLTNAGGNRSLTWDTSGFSNKSGTIVVDISTTNSPAGIVTTGYYRCTLEPEP